MLTVLVCVILYALLKPIQNAQNKRNQAYYNDRYNRRVDALRREWDKMDRMTEQARKRQEALMERIARSHWPDECPCCGAPVRSGTCEYCGKQF